MPLYFAYGSNMSAVQMQDRCPGASVIGHSTLMDWRFIITTRRTASIVPEKNACVHGVLWRCTPEHQFTLDRFEGVRIGNYRRRIVSVVGADGVWRNSIVYVGANRNRGIGRLDYLNTAVLPGARFHDLPLEYIDELETWLPQRPVGQRAGRYRGRKK